MNVDIFIRSYRPDFPWLAYCLRSLAKYAKGFGKIHLCVPVGDLELVPAGTNEEVHVVADWRDGYIQQQNDKLHCDMYCNAPYILCMDSDCILTREITPEDLFINGKPVWLYEDLPDPPWKEIVKESVGWEPEYEFMRRHPFVFDRQVLRDFRTFMFHRHQSALNVWLQGRPKHRFSEFNAFGAWAHKYRHHMYEWRHPSDLEPFVNQEWSWGGLTPEIKSKMDNILSS